MKNTNTYTIMSLNLLTSGVRLPGNPPFYKRITSINKMIQEYKPDIIGVQELTKDMMIYMSDIKKTYDIFGESRHSHVSDEYSSILYHKEKFDLLNAKTLWLSPTPEKIGSKFLTSQFPRIVTFVHLKDKQTNIEFTAFNTHLDNNFNSVRTKQAIALKKIIEQYQEGEFTILTGDFNCTSRSLALSILQTELNDTIPDTIHSTLRGSVGSYIQRQLPIDHIFISKHLVTSNTQKITKSYDNIYPSDHYPVITTIHTSNTK